MAEQKRNPDGAETLTGKVAVEGMLRCLSERREANARRDPPPKEPSPNEA